MRTEPCKTFKILGLLLSYPEEDWLQHLPAMRDILNKEAVVPVEAREGLLRFISYLETAEAMALQEEYVSLFDRSRALCLHLFEHVHGESRDRGQAMVDLMALYSEKGFEVTAKELPDYLPLFLEFLSFVGFQEAIELLQQPADILSSLGHRLRAQESGYASIIECLEYLAGRVPQMAEKPAALAEKENEDIDKEWEEQPVTFLGNTSCGDCSVSKLSPTLSAALERRD